MSLATRTFRLFLSSTFTDFQEERKALQKEVFPELERYCAENGARFQSVDLRWGISEEAQQEHATMRICLEEIRRCQKLSPRPNFAVLLGDRYGWEPVPARIPQDHWVRLMKHANPEGRTLIEDAYQLDENAVPSVYCLRKRSGDLIREYQREDQLLQALRHAARSFRGNNRLPYFASATHQEIWLGALAAHDATDHVHVYERKIQGLSVNKRFKDYIDWDHSTDLPTNGAHGCAKALVSKLESKLPNRVRKLGTRLTQGKVSKPYLERFCKQFLADQMAIIKREVDAQAQANRTEFDERELAHAEFAQDRSRIFEGRKRFLRRLAGYLNPGKKRGVAPLVFIGAGGSGKSALLAKGAKEDRNQTGRTGAVVVERYIGGVPGTESLMTMLSNLTADLAALYNQPQPTAPENIKAMTEAFQKALDYASVERPLHLYLDALDQLDSSYQAWMLEWLPYELPEHTRVIASLRVSTSAEQSARQRFATSLIELPPMNLTEGQAMLDAWLADKEAAWFNAGATPSTGRRLTPQQKQNLLRIFDKNGSALWLKLAYEEASTWPSWEKPRQLPASVEGLIKDLIDDRLFKRENHPRAFAERALAYLTAGRFGMSEEELTHALATDRSVKKEFEANSNRTRQMVHIESQRPRLPHILWSRLFFDLEPYLGQVHVDGALLMRWFHREFREVVAGLYLDTPKTMDAIHGNLAKVFLNIDCAARPGETNDDALFRATDMGGKQKSTALRRVMEQPWQLAQAGRREELEALLTDFGFCMGKCAANRSDDLINDYLSSDMPKHGDSRPAIWRSFMQGNAHMLRRGVVTWPAHKILQQLATEHADNSPVTRSAETWINTSDFDGLWLQSRERRKHLYPNRYSVVLEGHTGSIGGTVLLSDGRLASWGYDGDIRIWNCDSGSCELVLNRPQKPENWDWPFDGWQNVEGVREVSNGTLVSWYQGGFVRLWDLVSGRCEAEQLTQLGNLRDVRAVGQNSILFLDLLSGWLWNYKTGKVAFRVRHDSRHVEKLSDDLIAIFSFDKTIRLIDAQSGKCLVRLRGHKNYVRGAQLLPAARLLSWSDDCTLRIWDMASGKCLATLDGHTNVVEGVMVLSSGNIVSWSGDNTMRIWNQNTGACLSELEGHSDQLKDVQLLTDGRIMSLSGDGTIRIWDEESGNCDLELTGHADWVDGALELSDDRLISWSRDCSLRIWSTKTGVCLHEMLIPDGTPNGLKLLSKNRLLSWSEGRRERSVHLWNLETGELLSELVGGATSPESIVSLSSESFLVPCKDNVLRIWELESGQCVGTLRGHTSSVYGAVVSGAGSIVSWSSKELRLWNIKSILSAQAIDPAFNFSTELVEETVCLAEGVYLSRYRDGTLRAWDASTGSYLSVMSAAADRVAVLPNMRCLSMSSDGKMRIWSAVTGNCDATLTGHTEEIEGFELLPLDRLASWSLVSRTKVCSKDRMGRTVHGRNRDHIICVWDITTGSCISVLRGHKNRIGGVKNLPGNRLLSWSKDRTIRIWNVLSGDCLATTEGPSAALDEDVILLPDYRILFFSRQGDCSVRLWDGSDGRDPVVMSGHKQGVFCAQFLKTNHVLTRSSNELGLWNAVTGACIRIMRHPEVGGAIQISKDRLVSWSFDGTLRIWDASTGICKKILHGHASGWLKVEVLSGNRLMSSSGDNTVRIWDVRTGACLKTISQNPATIDKVSFLKSNAIVTWSDDGTLRRWSSSGRLMEVLSSRWVEELMSPQSSKLVEFDERSKQAGSWRSSSLDNRVSLTHLSGAYRCRWHGSGEVRLLAIAATGILTIEAANHLHFLQVYAGRKVRRLG